MMPGSQDGQNGGNQGAALIAGDFEYIALEAAQFGALNAGVHLAKQGTAGEIVADFQIVAVGEKRRGDRHLDVAAIAEQPDLQALLCERLAEESAIEFAVAIIQRDDLIATDQGRAEALFHFLFGLALRDHRGELAGRQD